MTKIAVLGYGTVGSGVVEVIQTNRDLINQKIGDSLEIKYILDLKEFPGSPIDCT
jgi:homoserine dehydrogenase